MKSKIVLMTLCLVAITGASGMANAKGCIKGAAAGAVAGHVAGHHAVAGAAGGCVVGRHLANKKAAEQKARAQPASSIAPLPSK